MQLDQTRTPNFIRDSLQQDLSAFYASLQSRTLAKWKKIKKISSVAHVQTLLKIYS